MRCCVPTCGQDIRSTLHGYSAHRFPSDFDRRLQWMKAIAAATPSVLKEELNLSGHRICSRHFTPDCYLTLKNNKRNRLVLFPSAVPSIFKPERGRNPPKEEDILAWMEKNPSNEKVIEKKNKPPKCGIHTDTSTGVDSTGAAFSRDQLVGVLPKIQKRYAQSQKIVKALRVQNMRLRNRLTQMEQLLDGKRGGVPPDGVKLEVKPQPIAEGNGQDHFANCSCCQKARKELQAGQQQTKIGRQTQAEGPEASTRLQPTPIPLGQDHCRLCFRKENLEPLCSGKIVSRDEMLEKIYVCTGVLVVPRPNERFFICASCEEFVSNFHTFRQQISSNNRAMKMAARWKTQPTALKGHTVVGSQPNASKHSVPLPPQTKYRKIIKKLPVSIVQPPGGSNTNVILKEPLIEPLKTEPIDDPLAGCSGLSRAGSPPPRFPVMPKPFVITRPSLPMQQKLPTRPISSVSLPLPVKRKLPTRPIQSVPLPKRPISSVRLRLPVNRPLPTIPISSAPLPTIPIPTAPLPTRPVPSIVPPRPEAEEEDKEEEETDSFRCWNCDSSFRFKFECAKHLLLAHREEVAGIKQRLELDELNSNMLEAMSEKNKV